MTKKPNPMVGVMLVIRAEAGGEPITYSEHVTPPTLDELHKIVGGYIEAVPNFTSIKWPMVPPSKRYRCVAFCNEDGKRLQLPRNNLADLFWCAALQADHGVHSCHPDFLVGNVVVLFGNPAFMRKL